MIDAGEYVYVVSRELGGGGLVGAFQNARRGPAHFTVNAPVQFAIEKHTMYLLDDDGREIKTKIVKRILKTERPE